MTVEKKQSSTGNIKKRDKIFPPALYNLFYYLKETWFARNIVVFLIIAGTASGIITYITIAHKSDELFGPDPIEVLKWVALDLVLLLILASVVSWKITSLWFAKWRGSVGSRLQSRIIVMFSMVSIIPTIIVVIFSILFFNYGIQTWFDKRVSTALEESTSVAEGYLKEHKENIRADVLAMANDINSQAMFLINNPARFKQFVTTQAALRSLTEAIVFQRSDILAKTDLSFSLMFEMESLPHDIMQRASDGEVVVLKSDTDDRVRALIKLNNFLDSYLLVGRFVDSKVMGYIETTQGSVNEYNRLKSNISSLQIQFSFVFIAVAILLLLATLWVGMIFAGELVEPVKTLITATERVKAGDLSTRIDEGPRNDEIGTLGRAFNRMTNQLQKHRGELVEVNKQIDERRRFIEAVLSGVSAGVIALDRKKNISLFNKGAVNLLSAKAQDFNNKSLSDVFPEASKLMEKAEKSPDLIIQEEVSILRNKRKTTFLVRIVTEEFSDEIEGYVVTFDDITDLLAAQRNAAWSDVARRIAHEIKNPLTPIHLSAERLRQKYEKQIKTDQKSFNKYVDTIIRHVGTVGKIVEEFASFARMPSPVLKRVDICEIIRDAVFSGQVVNPSIKYEMKVPDNEFFINGDKNQIMQAMVNVLKNAAEGIETGSKKSKSIKGKIKITAKKNNQYSTVEIQDNGSGFPGDLIDTITEPYVTTRENGTGLGLAIVKKVMVDHEGSIFVSNVVDSKGKIKGALVSLSFPSV